LKPKVIPFFSFTNEGCRTIIKERKDGGKSQKIVTPFDMYIEDNLEGRFER